MRVECSKYCAQKMNAILRYKCTIGSNVMKRYVALYARLFFLSVQCEYPLIGV